MVMKTTIEKQIERIQQLEKRSQQLGFNELKNRFRTMVYIPGTFINMDSRLYWFKVAAERKGAELTDVEKVQLLKQLYLAKQWPFEYLID